MWGGSLKGVFVETACDGAARSGVVTVAHRTFSTPCFMPVGTRGAVRHLTSQDLETLEAPVVLANTYHLMLRPGAEVIAELGGLHRFVGFDGPMLTDSGGYQIFSLKPQVDDRGAIFKSTYDGSTHRLTPESAVDIQARIGADIQMVLDVCAPANAEHDVLRSAVDRTALWATRGREAFLTHRSAAENQSQFGIVQGGTSEALRLESAQRIVSLDFDGYAIGGLSVGENRQQMLASLDACMTVLPRHQPRYFMGLGDPIGIVECVARGVDMFDCVLPTRLARHGTVLSDHGRINLRRAEYISSNEPLDPTWPQSPANRWSRGYLRHLLATKEPTAARILTLHNVAWLLRFMEQIAQAIQTQTFQQFRDSVHNAWFR